MEKPTYTAIDYNSKENKVIEFGIRFGLPIWIWIVLKDTLKVIMKLRDGGYLIFKCGMFSFIERMVIRLEEY